MTAITVDSGRRALLIQGTSAIAVTAAAATAIPFIASWLPTEATRLGGLPLRIDVSKLEEGAGIKFLWRGTPMWVIRRNPTAVQTLSSQRELLKDPDSNESLQPAYARNEHRSIQANIMVLTAICTHLGCLPEAKFIGDAQIGPNLSSGFYCPCHGSRFDAAGRVLKGSPASVNLPVPEHYFVDANTLIIGASAVNRSAA